MALTRTSPPPFEFPAHAGVAFVVADWDKESSEHRAHILDLATALTQQGHEVTVYTRRDSPDAPDRGLSKRGYHVVRVTAGPAQSLSSHDLLPHLEEFSDRLRAEWELTTPRVAHSHSWLSGLAVHPSEVPVVQSFHGSAGGRAPLPMSAEHDVLLAADHVVTTSNSDASELIRTAVHRARISLVPTGVDVSLFSPDGPVASRGDRPRLLSIGDVVPAAEHSTVIRALAGVPKAELLVVGAAQTHDDEVRALRELAADLGVAHRVRFTGEISHEHLPPLLRSADVVVHVPRTDHLGTTVLRAMACGTPVIAAHVGALPDLVIDVVTGLLTAPEDPDHLGVAVRRLLADSMHLDMYSIAGVDRARNRYSWDRIAAEHSVSYGRAITHHDPARSPARATL
ncbi:glycosyltransferase [Umezawaea sp. NPDC059074]|uniref:glycosyltransferase n=1 Tax=Umezawaea sp. NPDC059074 TaxID=3346716 RepID=UPI0036A3C6C3